MLLLRGEWDLDGLIADNHNHLASVAVLVADRDDAVRLAAAAFLGRGEFRSDHVVTALAKALHDSNPLVRAVAARSLGYLRSESELAIPVLCDLLSFDNPSVVQIATQALDEFRKVVKLPARPLLLALAKAVRDCNFPIIDHVSSILANASSAIQVAELFPNWDDDLVNAITKSIESASNDSAI